MNLVSPLAFCSLIRRYTLQDRRLKTIVSAQVMQSQQIHKESGNNGASMMAEQKAGLGSIKANIVDWNLVAQRHGNGRNSSDCMKRFNKITGNTNSNRLVALKGPWTLEEDNKIISLVKANGARKWSQIASQLPGTCVACFSNKDSKSYSVCK